MLQPPGEMYIQAIKMPLNLIIIKIPCWISFTVQPWLLGGIWWGERAAVLDTEKDQSKNGLDVEAESR